MRDLGPSPPSSSWGPLAGQGHELAILISAVSGLVCAGLWAQFIEGRRGSLRPYGYYGGLLGVIMGSLAAPLVGTSVWLVLAAYAVAGPWVQSSAASGASCRGAARPSRARGGGHPLHPSALAGLPAVRVDGRAAASHAALFHPLERRHRPRHHQAVDAPCAPDVHLGDVPHPDGAGALRGVNPYRGEPQTPVFGRLRLYQWTAVSTVVAGAIITTLGGAGAPRRRLAVVHAPPRCGVRPPDELGAGDGLPRLGPAVRAAGVSRQFENLA